MKPISLLFACTLITLSTNSYAKRTSYKLAAAVEECVELQTNSPQSNFKILECEFNVPVAA
ncbi:MAG: hypothetical protein KA715_13850 [Xanthomonadaceae bacterium]|nr:hypothetical protein [Xanthomonadaceae bacterium]